MTILETPLCPISGEPMMRGARPFVIAFRGREKAVALPGRYGDAGGGSLHSREDLAISDHALASLKAQAEEAGLAR